MDGQSEIARLQKALGQFGEDASQWKQLAGRDALLDGAIREAVQEALQPDGVDVAPALDQCLRLLPEDTPVRIQKHLWTNGLKAAPKQAEAHPMDFCADLLRRAHMFERLHLNAKGMLETGLAAVAAAQVMNREGALKDLFKWWRKAIHSIGGTAGSGEPTYDASKVSGYSQAIPLARTRAIVEWAHRECVAKGWVLPGPYRWTMDWLNGTRWRTGRCLSVKAAGVHTMPSIGGGNELRGFLAEIRLEELGGREGLLVEHPEVRLRPFDEDFRQGLAEAWRGAQRNDSTPNVCWSLAVPEEAAPPWQPLCGDSLSGAAARAFWHAVRGEAPDAGVVVLARVRRDASPLEPELLLAEVDDETIPLKVMAAAADPSIDTIVVAGENNAKRAVEALIGEARGRIRIVDLSADQNK